MSTLIFVKTVFDVEKCLESCQGLSRRTHFFLFEYSRFLKMYAQHAVLNERIWMMTGDLLHVNGIN